MHADPEILKHIKTALKDRYGDRLDRVVLFGSRARGDARKDSDYDVAVYVDGIDDISDEIMQLARVAFQLLLETDALISFKPFDTRAPRFAPLITRAVEDEGIAL